MSESVTITAFVSYLISCFKINEQGKCQLMTLVLHLGSWKWSLCITEEQFDMPFTCWIINVYHLFNSRNFLGVTYGVQNVIFVHYFPVNIIFNHSFRTNICFDRTTAFYIPWWHGMPVFDAFREFTHTKVINGCASLITQANLYLPMWEDAFIDDFAWLLS